MREDVIKRLDSLGYTVTDADGFGLIFVIDKVTNTIKNECNVSEIPEGLHQIAVDMICGEFLLAKNRSGQLIGFDTTEAVKQLKSGDTNITYAVADGLTTIESLIDWLLNSGRSQFAAFRRIKW